MASSEARRQKKLQKLKAKRNEKKTTLARRTSNDPAVRLANVANWAVVGASVPDNLFALGLGQGVIARRAPDGFVATGVFLIDTYCLGVKNAFWRGDSVVDYEQIKTKIDQETPLRSVAPSYLAKLVADAGAYAAALGFKPHADFRHARLLLSGIDPGLCTEEFEFGKDGKPLYVRGPNESIPTAKRIGEAVTALGGHWVMQYGPGRPSVTASANYNFSDNDDEDGFEETPRLGG